MAKPFDIIDKFGTDVSLKFRCQIIHCTGKHEILPYDQSQFIAKIIEPVFRIITTAPYTNGVEIGSLTLFQQFSGCSRSYSSQQMILRNIISSHGKNIFFIDLMSKADTPLIRFYMHGHRAKSNPSLPGIHFFSAPI